MTAPDPVTVHVARPRLGLPAAALLHAVPTTVLFVAGVLFVTRQALLLRERATTPDELTRLRLENDRLADELRRVREEQALDERRATGATGAVAVGDLAAGVAHELNNPLSAVLGFAELLLEDLDPDDPRRPDVETIRDQAIRARAVIRALGDFAANGDPASGPSDIGSLLRRTVDAPSTDEPTAPASR